MHIVLVHQYYLHPTQTGSARFNDMAKVWVEAGHRVTVVAGQVDYTSGAKREDWRGRRVVSSEQEGVEVHRVFTPNTYQRAVLGRALSWGGFALAAADFLARDVGHCDICIVTSPPLTLALCAAVAKLKRWPLIVEVRDLWPASAVAVGALSESSVVTRGLEVVESGMYNMATKLVSLTPGITRDIVERGLVLPAKIVEIPNGADIAVLRGKGMTKARRRQRRRELGWPEDLFVVLYAGAHGRANGLEQLLEVAQEIKHRGLRAMIVTVGDGPVRQGLMERTDELGLGEQLMWQGRVSKEEVPEWMGVADCGLAILRPHEVFKTVYPNKMFDAMSASVPVLCAIEGVAAHFVEGNQVGLTAPSGDTEALVGAMEWMMSHQKSSKEMGVRGRALVEGEYNRQVLGERYLEVIKEVVGA